MRLAIGFRVVDVVLLDEVLLMPRKMGQGSTDVAGEGFGFAPSGAKANASFVIAIFQAKEMR